MKTLTNLIVVVAIAALAVIGYAYSGLYDVSATSRHSSVVGWLLSTTSHASVERRASEVVVPDLRDEALILAGVNDFDSMCAGCHGAPGKNPEAMGQGLNPAAPDLSEEASELSAAELFWVTKNGIKMTGMPAWGVTHDDGSIWPVVAFMTRLPELDEAGYQQLLTDAAGHGHHADDAAGEDHSHEDADASPVGEVHIHEDGSEHGHEEQAEPEPPEHDQSTHEHNR